MPFGPIWHARANPNLNNDFKKLLDYVIGSVVSFVTDCSKKVIWDKAKLLPLLVKVIFETVYYPTLSKLNVILWFQVFFCVLLYKML